MINPATIWITGLSASGKTTLGERLLKGLIENGVKNVEFLDGEILRSKVGAALGYSTSDRNTMIAHTIKIAKELNEKGTVCIVATISHKNQTRQRARAAIGNFMEVYLACPVEVCVARDYKGNYKKAFGGEYKNFVGVTEPYEVSDDPELVLDTAANTIDECSRILVKKVVEFLDSEKDGRILNMQEYGKPLHENLRYCVRCCMPETSEGIIFDEMGICRGCQSSEQKMHIKWAEREKELRNILEQHKAKSGDNYDCLIPISGGKDSAFQMHALTKLYKVKPLAVTFNHNWLSETGKYNLWNMLEKTNIDHIMFTPNRSLVNRLAKKSLYKIGDSCWHCHAGIPAFTLQVAVKFNIPLIVWGESIAEFGSKASYKDPVKFDENHYLKVSSKVQPEEMLDEEIPISAKDICPFKIPSKEELDKIGIMGIHLGDYIFWDTERQVEFIKKEYGWREDDVEGTYKKYKSVECIMAGVHDYAKYIKRGFGRATDHASIDVRTGILTREEGFELIKEFDPKRPSALDYYLKITNMTPEEFKKVLISQRKDKAKELPEP